MFSLIVHARVRNKIEEYILAYRSIFLEIYDDTWLGDAEEIIRNQYKEKSKLLKNTILTSIEESLRKEVIAYSSVDDKRATTIRIWSRRMFLKYDEDLKTMTRYILDIEILQR